MPNQLMTTDEPATGGAAQATLGTVLVTGAASGLGAAVAEAVEQRGGLPIAVDRVPVASPHTVAVDLADTTAAEAAIAGAIRGAGGLDAVVCAAGTDACGRLEDVSRDAWEQVIRVNLLGMAATIRAALPALRASGRGRIVTVASTLGHRALPDATAYCASKFGVVGFSRALAAELAGEVGVTTLVPGGMATAFFDGRPAQYRPPADASLADPAQIAEAVLFALTRPPGIELREVAIMPATEPSWP